MKQVSRKLGSKCWRGVEIEFSRYEFIYRDHFRFLSAYNADKIDVGVLIINADPKGGRVKHPAVAPSLARVKDDLAWLRPTLTVPLWIVALKWLCYLGNAAWRSGQKPRGLR